MRGILVWAGLIALVGAGPALAIGVDFEDLAIPVNGQINPAAGVGIVSQGFNFTPGPNNASGLNDLHIYHPGSSIGPNNGTQVGASHDDVVLTSVSGAAFSLSSFDFAGFPNGNEIAFTVTGSLAGGGNIVANFTPDGIVDGVGGRPDFETFALGAGWNNLTSVTWSHTGAGTTQGLFGLDNINTNPVPEPGTVALFALGVLGVAGVARRRRKSRA